MSRCQMYSPGVFIDEHLQVLILANAECVYDGGLPG